MPSGGMTVAAFFDIEKAFDKMWHQGLLYKLHTGQSFSTGLLQLLSSFLSNRYVRFRVEDKVSNPLLLPAGTPQGSVLSPTLFILWVNDIPPPRQTRTDLSQYADDIAIWSQARNPGDARDKLQEYTNLILAWCKKWRIKLSPAKTQLLCIMQKAPQNPHAIYLDMEGTRVDVSKTAKFLGITLDSKLNLDAHAKNVIARVQQRTSALKKIAGHYTRPRASVQVSSRVYKAMIRPLTEYAPTVEVLFRKSNWVKLEKLQQKAAKTALRWPRPVSGKLATKTLGLPTIQQRVTDLALKYLGSEKRTPRQTQMHANALDRANRIGRFRGTPPLRLKPRI